jgi:hypothetical protein
MSSPNSSKRTEIAQKDDRSNLEKMREAGFAVNTFSTRNSPFSRNTPGRPPGPACGTATPEIMDELGKQYQ